MPLKRVFLVLLISIFINNLGAVQEHLMYLNRILGNNEINIDKSYKRLSQGTILLPDNPSNYAIYEKLEAHIRELDNTIRNNGDMISYYQTADGYLSEITELLQNIRELLLKKSNAIYSPEDKEYIDMEISQYYDQIIYSLKNSEFNTKKIFKGLFTDKTILEQLHDKKYYQVSNVDELLSIFIRQRSTYGSMTSLLELRNQGQAISAENMNAFQSNLIDINIADEITRLKKNHLLFLVNLLLLQK